MWWVLGVCAGGEAHAAELDDWIVAWSTVLDGDRGSDGRDELLGVAVDQTQHVVVTGFVDGEAGLGRTAFLGTFERHDGSLLWFERTEAGAIADTDDVFTSVDFAPGTNELAWCGQLGGLDGSKAAAPAHAYHVDVREPAKSGIHYPSVPLWSDVYEASPGTGGTQACRGLDRAGLTLFTTGDAETSGGGRQWVSRVYDARDGTPTTVAFPLGAPTTRETGHAIAGDPATGDFVVVGSSATEEAVQAAVVRLVDAQGDVVWSDTIAEEGDTTFLDVAWDIPRGLVAAVGTTQRGSEDASDVQGIVRVYGAAGLDGAPDVQMTVELGSDAGDDHATSVSFDGAGRLLVGGSVADPTTGIERWRVLRLSETTGEGQGSWEGDATSGPSRIRALAWRDEVLAVAGFVDRGNTVDAAVALLGPDADGDGVADIADQCPEDPDKIFQGICDCGRPDDDRDGDDFEDCIDRCPDDPLKATRMGECGGGTPDVDEDNDDVLDCLESCPGDPNKSEPGACGCGTLDLDLDEDGVADCDDRCIEEASGEVDADGCEPSGCGCRASGVGSASGPLLIVLLAGLRRRLRNGI